MLPLTLPGIVLLVVALPTILVVPRRWAPVPILVMACYTTLAQGVMLGPFNFFSIRLVILAGFVRLIVLGEYRGLPASPLDRLMLVWSCLALAASIFRPDPVATLTFNGGLVFNALGTYILLRAFCRSPADLIFLCRVVAWLLLPVALMMVYEKLTASNLFSYLGGVPAVPDIRGGRVRAQGPFAHAILAGTVGGAMLPLCVGLWNLRRGAALVGAFAAVTMVIASASSGPLMSAMVAVVGLLCWNIRAAMSTIRWAALAAYGLLMVIMTTPPYYLMARIDLTGGSTGWHRARLIEASMEHLGEWWLAGTDFTRHWIASGVGWSPNHTDITNHYLLLGVLGGLPLLILFVILLAKCFSLVGQSVHLMERKRPDYAFLYWALGVSLFSHVTSSLAIAYYDQSFVFLYVTIAAIASLGGPEFTRLAHQRPSRLFVRPLLSVGMGSNP